MSKRLIIVDGSVLFNESFVEQFTASDDILILNTADGLAEQLEQYLSDSSNSSLYDSVHILSHANDGRLLVGGSLLTSDNLSVYAPVLSRLGDSLTTGADLMLYGCSLAATSTGKTFVADFANLLGADAAASVDITGSAGDNDLEFQLGLIESNTLDFTGVQTEALIDDYGQTVKDAGTVTVARDVIANFDLSTDRDWFSIYLETGVGYTLDLGGVSSKRGTSANPEIEGIYNSRGLLTTSNLVANAGSGSDDRMHFTPLSTGTYYISVAPTDVNSLGTYTLNVDTGLAQMLVDVGDDYGESNDVEFGYGYIDTFYEVYGSVELSGDQDWFKNFEDVTTGHEYELRVVTSDGPYQGISSPVYLNINSSEAQYWGTGVPAFAQPLESYIDERVIDSSVDLGGVEFASSLRFSAATSSPVMFSVAGVPGWFGDYTLSLTDLGAPSRDDYGDTTVSAINLSEDVSRSAAHESRVYDADWYRVYLTGGSVYRIEIEGSATQAGSLADPEFGGVYDSSGKYLAGTKANANAGKGSNEQIDFTPDTTGYYYFSSLADSGAIGTYQITYTEYIPFNFTPSGSVLINGITQDGETLTVSNNLSDGNGMGAVSYTWYADGSVLENSGTSLFLTEDFLGQTIQVVARFTDLDGYSHSVASLATSEVTHLNVEPTGLPNILGLPVGDEPLLQGDTLSVDTSNIDDVDGLGTFSYQWLADGVEIDGGDASSFELEQDQVGMFISVQVSYTDGYGALETLVSAQSPQTVQNINDTPVGIPIIQGPFEEGSALEAVMSEVLDLDGIGDYSFKWYADSVLMDDETEGVLILTQDDVGSVIRLEVNYVDGFGQAEGPLLSDPTPVIANVNNLPEGEPLIFGDPVQGETLSIDTTGISDTDGLGVFSYQWYASGVAIEGATDPTLLLTQSEVNKNIHVELSYTDSFGSLEGPLPSTDTEQVANINDVPAGQPEIVGELLEGQTLSVSMAAVIEPDGFGEFEYQWYLDSDPIAGATAPTFALSQVDVGRTVFVEVSYTDDFGEPEGPLTSAITEAVANLNDLPTGDPVASGELTQGETLSVSTASIADADGLGAFSYQWLRDGEEIVDATEDTYTSTQEDVNTRLSIVVSYTDGYGAEESLITTLNSIIVNVNDEPEGVPEVIGEAFVDETLRVDTTGISDLDGLGTFYYQWYRDDALQLGATTSSYTLTDDDLGSSLYVRVLYIDGFRNREILYSESTATVALPNRPIQGELVLLGMAREGELIVADSSGLSDENGLGEFSYQWFRDGEVQPEESSDTYLLRQSDVGARISLKLSYTDEGGYPESITTELEELVVNVNQLPQGGVSITGTPQEGELLLATTSQLTDDDGLGTFIYRWFADDELLTGADTALLLLTPELVGVAISVEVSYEDGGGNTESLISEKTDPVGAIIPQLGTDEAETLFGSDLNDYIDGKGGDDFIYGYAGDDILIGGTGADFMSGGYGNDTYYVDDSGDIVFEENNDPFEPYVITLSNGADEFPQEPTVGSNIDQVFASIDYILTEYVENLVLSEGALYAEGNELDNELYGNDLNNVLVGLEGDDYLFGDAGIDTAIYRGLDTEYQFSLDVPLELSSDPIQFLVTDPVSGRDGLDLLNGVERLQFNNISRAFDIDGANSAGGIYRTYQAAFDREPDLGGFGYWIARADTGATAVQMAEEFVWSQEFQEVYQVTTTDQYLSGSDISSVVKGFYENVLGRDPDQGGLDYYSSVIIKNEKTAGRVLAEIADSPENRVNLLSQIETGMSYILWEG